MNAILRYPGAKWAIADKIIALFPEHRSYIEPYFGSGAILFNKKQVPLETVNDIDSEVVNFFEVLRSDYKHLQEALRLTPYSREVYAQICSTDPTDKFDKAYRFFVRHWMSMGGGQRYKTGWCHTNTTQHGKNLAVKFKSTIDSLEEYVERLRTVQIEHMDAINLIPKHDFKGTLIYIDPPYMMNTRKQKYYKEEMTIEDDHQRLLDTILQLKKAMVIVSGYDNELYNSKLANWNRRTFETYDFCSQLKVEVVWFNYQINKQQELF